MSPKRRLYIHIGGNKTGSSAIQSFLGANAPKLLEHGLVVPSQEFTYDLHGTGDQVFAFQRLLDDSDGRERLEGKIHDLFSAAAGADGVVLSGENLAAHPAGPSLFAGLREHYDLHVIIYIRRQDEYIVSSWLQWYSKLSDDFWGWAIGELGILGDWRAILERWEAVIPREQIAVRVFDRGRLQGGDVVADFYKMLQIDCPIESLARPSMQVNPSFCDAVMDLVVGNKAIFSDVHDNRFYDFVQSFTGAQYVRSGRESQITFRQREAILERYAESNSWVKATYFKDVDEPLFTPPIASNYDKPCGERKLAMQLQFLTAMLYLSHQNRVSGREDE